MIIQHGWRPGMRTAWCGQERDLTNPEHRLLEGVGETERPICAKCHRAIALYWSQRNGKRSTAWIPLGEIAWVDRVTGEHRRERVGKHIEVVTAAHGEILVSDDASGTHRMIPVANLLDYSWAVFE